MELTKIAIDTGTEISGVWFDYDAEVAFLIARSGNPAHNKALRAAVKPHQRRIVAGNLPVEVSDKIEADVAARTLLLDWRGLTLEGKPFNFSYDNAIILLTDKRFAGLKRELLEFADAEENFRITTREDEVKNLKSSSTGN